MIYLARLFSYSVFLLFILICHFALAQNQKRIINPIITYNGTAIKDAKIYFIGFEGQMYALNEQGAISIEVPENLKMEPNIKSYYVFPNGIKRNFNLLNIPEKPYRVQLTGPEYNPGKDIIAKTDEKKEESIVKESPKNELLTDNKDKKVLADKNEKEKTAEVEKKEDPSKESFVLKNYTNEFRNITDRIDVEKQIVVNGNNEIKQRLVKLFARLRNVDNISNSERDSLKNYVEALDLKLQEYSAAYQESQTELRNTLQQIRDILYEQEMRIRLNRITILTLLGIILGLAMLSYVFFIINKRIKKQREILAEKVREINWQKEQIRIQRDSLNTSNKQLELTTQELSEKIQEVNQQKDEIKKQRDAIELKSKELEVAYTRIQDSVVYAKRIQNAFMFQPNKINDYFKESFVLHEPKDIVSGDFYWFSQKGDETVVAVVDCTGHGVPGAFMTLLSTALLDNIVNENGVTDPAEILKMLDEKVQVILHQQEMLDGMAINTDGMDLFILNVNKKKKISKFAGAKNTMYILKNNKIEQIRGSRFPIGSFPFDEEKVFESHQIKFNGGEVFYLFTDGYQDQLGGDNDEKFLKSRFRELLYSLSNLTLPEQKEKLEEVLQDWKKDQPQTDDVLVIGLKV